MSPAARSLFVFGIYVTVAGLTFLVAPAAMIELLRFPPASDGWLRVVGLLAVAIGVYDMVGSSSGSLAYVRASVWVRVGFAAGIALLVVTGQMTPPVIVFGFVDLVGAVWTARALRRPSPNVVA